MRIKFEDWSREKGFSHKVNQSFIDSIKCYRHWIYRAAILLSYLWLLQFVKDNVLKSIKPDDIAQPQRDSILKRLKNEDTRENETYCIIQRSKSPILNLSDRLRRDVEYWKNIRNDCAHNKTQEIDHANVEVLYNFIISNLFKLTVSWGKEIFIKELSKVYSSGSEDWWALNNLISQLKSYYDDVWDTDYFWNEVFWVIFKSDHIWISVVSFCESIFKTYDKDWIIESFIKYLNAKWSLQKERLLTSNLVYLSYFYKNNKELKSFWIDRQITSEVAEHLIENNLINDEDAYDFVNKFISGRNAFKSDSITFLSYVKKLKFVGDIYANNFNKDIFSDFKRVQKKINKIKWYLKNFDLDEKNIKLINDHFLLENYSYSLLNFLTDESQILEQFSKVSKRLWIELSPLLENQIKLNNGTDIEIDIE